jgi:hypothetical protein
MAAFFFVTSVGVEEAAASTELVTRTTVGAEEIVGGVLVIDVVGRAEGMDEEIEMVDDDDDVVGTMLLLLLLDDNEVLMTVLSCTLVGEADEEEVEGALGLLGGVTDG